MEEVVKKPKYQWGEILFYFAYENHLPKLKSINVETIKKLNSQEYKYGNGQGFYIRECLLFPDVPSLLNDINNRHKECALNSLEENLKND